MAWISRPSDLHLATPRTEPVRGWIADTPRPGITAVSQPLGLEQAPLKHDQELVPAPSNVRLAKLLDEPETATGLSGLSG